MFGNRTLLTFVFAAIVAPLVLFSGVVHAEPSGKVMIYHAGSLTVPLKSMIEEFGKKYPGITVETKGGGSTKMARLISEKGDAADIMASADYVVIDKNLIPKFADWNALFASNQMVLCYTDKSKDADTINADNWYEILQKPGISWGHSDPNLDPCGYRSLMVLQLAEKYYDKPGLYDALLKNRPEENVLPKAAGLLKLLESGKLDYAWEYRSVAVQHGLKFVELNDHINLGNYAMDPFYKEAKVEVTGAKDGEKITRVGGSITYGVTQLKNAPNPDAATLFLEYMFSPEGGLKILKAMGQPPFEPVRVGSEAMKDTMPKALQGLVEVQK
ncbi:tungstate ABC transporter substrate-binding protein WtpA [Desulfovibrio inopinatus]|uniref:tungstate ABC transporter substrate-binding protein WtpA n=1 Tax=Desulfovibrio inopinatus TaxID=102109 RepID=UPI000416E46D|nr:tungstate ABC transporter substrate-binding protein WtpA [Desulfovibrio inopinatus]